MFSEREDWEGVVSLRRQKGPKMFELTVERLLGEQVRADGARAVELWSSLANVEWRGPDDAVVTYSFRSAGDLIAWVREDGCYLDWYCSGPVGVVSRWISDALAAEGWTWTGRSK